MKGLLKLLTGPRSLVSGGLFCLSETGCFFSENDEVMKFVLRPSNDCPSPLVGRPRPGYDRGEQKTLPMFGPAP